MQIALRAACFCAVTHSCLHCASLPLLFLVFFCCPGFVFSCFACTLLIITLMPSFCCLFCWMMLGAPCLLCACWVLSPLKIQPASPRERSRVVCPLSLRGDRFACCLYAVFLWCLIWAISKNRDRCSETLHKTKKMQFLHQYKSRALGVGYFSELQSVKFDPFANPAIPHLQQKACIHDPWGRGASTCVCSFGHIHITDWGSHQAYRLAQLGSPKSSANRNFLGPNLPAKRGGEREREKEKERERERTRVS